MPSRRRTASPPVSLLLAASPRRLRRAETAEDVVLGFDGADAKLTQQWMDEGKLPNLAKLRDAGHLRAAALDHPVADAGLLVDLRDRPQPRAGTASSTS